MKKWPKNETEIVSFSELIDPVRESLEAAYELRRKKIKNVPYNGYRFGLQSSAGMPQPADQLKADMIAYHAERDRDVLDIILMIAFNLGLEQGIRMEAKNSQLWQRIAEGFQKEPTSKK